MLHRYPHIYLQELTPEQMIFQAASRHEFIYQKALLIFQAKANQFHKIRMIELPQIIHFSLSNTKENTQFVYPELKSSKKLHVNG